MKITICAFDAPNNLDGPTTWMKRLLPYLKEHGIETRIIFLAANSKDLPAYKFFADEGFECKLIYWELFNDEKIQAILNDVKQFPPDIFIANYFAIPLTAAKWIKKAGIPTVMVLHNDNQYHYDLVKKFAANNDESDVSSVVAVSNLIEEISKQTAPLHNNIRYIPYGAPVPSEVANLSKDGVLNVVYAGRIDERQKRISEVTQAFCKAAKEVTGTNYTIYGDGPAVPAVQDILNTEGKGLPIQFKGKLKSTEVQDHLLQNQVFVLLSDFEGLPITLIEAMACGLVPICTYMRSGISDLVTDGEEGFLVENRKERFVAAIKKIKEDPALWKNMSKAGRQKIEASYSIEASSKQWMALLKELITNAGERSQLIMPSSKELKTIVLDKEFHRQNNPRPAEILVPFYKTKYMLGRLKRNLFKSK
ncbi:MAG: glycosyltransferase family 4 protein [Ferruginibacter sp.]|nr:glycosyltransferase family 4 protein [Ferruginibacter sp.]